MFKKFFRKIVPAVPGSPRGPLVLVVTPPTALAEPVVDFLTPFIQFSRMRINSLRMSSCCPTSVVARKLRRIEAKIDNFQRLVICPTGLDLELSIIMVVELINGITADLDQVVSEMGVVETV
jgi:hypothetical protein